MSNKIHESLRKSRKTSCLCNIRPVSHSPEFDSILLIFDEVSHSVSYHIPIIVFQTVNVKEQIEGELGCEP